jgi:hypothetical protein
MDYTRSALIRSKSISELMFEQDRTFREAVSDKFKARAMGFKEKFTPMNFVRMLTGSGTIGRSIRTVAGRAMNYSERDIERFGGYKRKRSIYGPDRSRVPSGAKTPVKVGDSTADILAKIYNLMRKIDEDNTRRYEEENNFTEENQLEGKKRHGKLLEALGMKKKGTVTPKTYAPEKKPKEEEDDKSGGILSKIFGSIFGVFGKTFKMLASLGGIIVAAVTGLFGMIKSLMGMAKMIISTVMELVAKMVMPLIEGIFNSIVKFITKVLPEFATGLIRLVTGVSTAMESLFKVVREILDNTFVAALLGKRAAIASAVLSTAFAAYQFFKSPADEVTQRKQDEDLYIGKEAVNDYNESNKYENKAVAADVPIEYKKQYAESAKIFRESADEKASEYQATLASSLSQLGFSFQGYDKNNLPIFKDKNGNIPLREDLISARAIGKTVSENSFTKGLFDKINPMNSEAYYKVQDTIHDEMNRMTSVGEQFKTMLDKVINIPSQMADEGASYIKDALAQAGDFISHITGPTEQTIAMPTVRNTEKTFQDRIRAITYVV